MLEGVRYLCVKGSTEAYLKKQGVGPQRSLGDSQQEVVPSIGSHLTPWAVITGIEWLLVEGKKQLTGSSSGQIGCSHSQPSRRYNCQGPFSILGCDRMLLVENSALNCLVTSFLGGSHFEPRLGPFGVIYKG